MTIFWLIFLFNAIVIFYIVLFGRLLCPDFDKAWSINEVNQHTGDDDFWVAIQGSVYDVTNFIHGQHSTIPNLRSNTPDTLSIVAGQDLTGYFPPPIPLACGGLVPQGSTLQMMSANFTPQAPQAMHKSGPTVGAQGTKLENRDWYTKNFLPKIREFRKGPVVIDKKAIRAAANDPDNQRSVQLLLRVRPSADAHFRLWAIYDDSVYDLTDYVYTASLDSQFNFLDEDLVTLFQQQPGQDITESLNRILNSLEPEKRAQNLNCMSNLFFQGKPDFRDSPRCRVQNILLLVISIILMVSVGVKCKCICFVD